MRFLKRINLGWPFGRRKQTRTGDVLFIDLGGGAPGHKFFEEGRVGPLLKGREDRRGNVFSIDETVKRESDVAKRDIVKTLRRLKPGSVKIINSDYLLFERVLLSPKETDEILGLVRSRLKKNGRLYVSVRERLAEHAVEELGKHGFKVERVVDGHPSAYRTTFGKIFGEGFAGGFPVTRIVARPKA